MFIYIEFLTINKKAVSGQIESILPNTGSLHSFP